MGAGGQRPGLEVRQERGIFLRLLGDPVDGRGRPRSTSASDVPAGRRRAVSASIGIAVRARLGMAQQLVELGLDPRADGALQAPRLLVALRPPETHDAA